MKDGDDRDGRQGGAKAGGEFGDAEEFEGEGGDPVGERRFIDPDERVPVGNEPAGLEHLAGDLGVDTFVPVGKAVVAEEDKDDERGEEGSEEGGAATLAAEGSGFVLCVRFRGHASSVREVGCEKRVCGR